MYQIEFIVVSTSGAQKGRMSGKWDKYSEYCITHPKTNKQKQRQNKTKSTSENVRSKDIMVEVYI